MSKTTISIENISKLYRLGVIGTGTFKDDMRIWWAKTRNKPNPLQIVDKIDIDYDKKNTLWALKNVSFKVDKGEAVGIIGRNGAGKSTLLKILSRVTTPTSGEVKVKGRIASLLEVGTGFHPELTGRENIYLNGAIMGMSRAEVVSKFDEIVDFSGVEQFIDTPVKRYSSGMYVRLAFAVAAHLEPEILIVDEVLAVGDAEFQNKCLGKMGDVSKEGRTVLFVSHSMAAIATLCNRAIWLDNGLLKMDGETACVVSEYLGSHISSEPNNSLEGSLHFGSGKARFTEILIKSINNEGKENSIFLTGHDLLISVKVKANMQVSEANVGIVLYDATGYRIVDANLALKNQYINLSPGEEKTITFTLKKILLKPGQYLVGMWMVRTNIEDIDGITYARSISIDLDTQQIQHSQIFPGIYQCKFDFQIQ